MPALENLLHHERHGLHFLRRAHLHVHRIDALDCREVAQHGDRDQHGFARQLDLAEGRDLLLERADHGELQTVDLDDLADAPSDWLP